MTRQTSVPKQIKLIRQRSKDWVDKHSVCGITDQAITSKSGYILTTCDQAFYIPAILDAVKKEVKDAKTSSLQIDGKWNVAVSFHSTYIF